MLQGNTVLDTMEPISILVSNAGPTLLLNNVVRSRPDVQEGPVVTCEAGLDGEYFAAGNTFTVTAPFRPRQVFREYETKVVASADCSPGSARCRDAIRPRASGPGSRSQRRRQDDSGCH